MEISNGHHQVMASYPLNEALPDLGCPKASGQISQETKPRPQQHPQETLRCPRCDSGNTKFCYYNNYSLTQPRYFCKSCRRYWTKGGTLRNVPVGGGCRKNKRSSSSSSSSSPSSSKKLALRQEHHDNFATLPLPPLLPFDSNDLSLAFSNLQNDAFLLGSHNPSSIPAGHGFLDFLRSGHMGPADPSPAIGGLHGLYYGFGGGGGEVEGGDNGAVLPFNHEGVSVSDGTMAEATHAGASTSHGSYWNGAGPASWHGFIIHDGA